MRNIYETRVTPTACLRRRNRQIDRLVYQLYDLSPAEIAIVEGRDS